LEAGAIATDARKAANRKWDAAHMATLGVRLKVEEAEAFKSYAAERGQTVNSVLAGYVRRCLAEDAAAKQHDTE
jgi:hypothetical protein